MQEAAERLFQKSDPHSGPPKPRFGWVYLLSAGNRYKIGLTTSPVEKRVATIQANTPWDIVIEHIICSSDVRATEKRLHDQFEEKRVNGEWFNLTPEDVKYIKSLECEA